MKPWALCNALTKCEAQVLIKCKFPPKPSKESDAGPARGLSPGCPTVRSCPVMSGECPVNVRSTVRWWCPICPISVRLVSDDVRCKVDSSRYCIVRNVRFGVRSCPKCPIWCPVMSGAVRCCPILSHLLYMILKHYQNTLSARAKGCVAELLQNVGAVPQ